MPIVCGSIGKCKNCGHELFFKSTGEIHHFTRLYHPYGLPYTTIKCYFPTKEKNVFGQAKYCNCENPEVILEKLTECEKEIIRTIQEVWDKSEYGN